MQNHPTSASPGRSRWVLLAFLAIAGFYLVVEHRVHLGGTLRWLPLSLLLLCPLLHVAMHRGHEPNGKIHRSPRDTEDGQPSERGGDH